MSGTKPNFLNGQPLPLDYCPPPNPYISPAPSTVNLLELSRYAQASGKSLSELSQEELMRFRI